MSAPIQDGGPAFPCHTNPLPEKLANAPQGMTLRDYFAGQALAGMLSSGIPDGVVGAHWTEDDYGEQSYSFADAMLTAREVKP